MENCTAAGEEIDVAHGWSLVMEDCRVSGSGGRGVDCRGKLEATRCIIEGSDSDGVHVNGKDGWDGWDVQLVECRRPTVRAASGVSRNIRYKRPIREIIPERGISVAAD